MNKKFSFRIDYAIEWQGGGHCLVFGISEEGLESFLLKKYVGYDELSHALAVEWK